MKRKKIIVGLLSSFFILAGPSGVISFLVFGLPPQFQDTYVAALAKQFKRLNEETTQKKIIFVGGSSTCFGLRSDLISEELPNYKAVDFGLYISLGTKMMIDLSKSNIQRGDLVVLTPEMVSQAWSTYFNADIASKALESNWRMFDYLPYRDQQLILSSCGGFVSDKLAYSSGKKASSSGEVYQNSSINVLGDVCYPRPYNVLTGLSDPTTKIKFTKEIVSTDFIKYVNDYADFVKNRGAKLLFSYAPMNRAAISSNDKEINDFDDFIFSQIHVDLISSPMDYIFDPLYFFDSNFHLNDAGSLARTKQIIKDIKRYLGIISPTNIQVPDPPAVPTDNSSSSTGLDEYAKFYSFQDYNDYSNQKIGVKLAGIKPNFLSESKLTTPNKDSEDYHVISIQTKAFSTAQNLKQLNIYSIWLSFIEEGAFAGAGNLKSIYLSQTDPAKIVVPLSGLMEGTSNCKIYVPQKSLSLYQNDYYWGNYFAYLVGY